MTVTSVSECLTTSASNTLKRGKVFAQSSHYDTSIEVRDPQHPLNYILQPKPFLMWEQPPKRQQDTP